jgi:hypothetical protein
MELLKKFSQMASRNVFNTFTVAGRSKYFHKEINLKEILIVLFCIFQKHCDSGNILKLPCAKSIAYITLYLTVYLLDIEHASGNMRTNISV